MSDVGHSDCGYDDGCRVSTRTRRGGGFADDMTTALATERLRARVLCVALPALP